MITKNFHPNYGGNLEFSKINKKRTKLEKEIDNR